MTDDPNAVPDTGALPPPRLGTNVAPPDPFAPDTSPTIGQTAAAAFRQQNPIVSVIDAVSSMPGNQPQPGYNPLDTLKGTPHESDDLSIYAGSHNEGYTRALMARKDSEDADRRTLAAAGWPGVAASIGAGLLDPTMLLPVVGEARLGKTAAFALYGAAQTAGTETALQASQVERPWQESVGNIASGTILGGMLGGAAGYLSKAEVTAGAKALDEVRPRVDANIGDLVARPAGAAPTDIRTLDLAGALGVQKVGVSPNLRIYGSSSVEAKRAMNDVAEFGGQFADAGTGQVAPFGAPLESQARVLKGQAMVQANDIIEDAWKQHYFGENQPGAIRGFVAKEGLGAPTTADKLGFGDFDRAVGVAMHNGDVHSIPEVQQAAQELRAKIFDPIKESAQSTLDRDGKPMLGPELEAPNGAQSFFPLIPVRDALVAKRYEAQDLFTNFLEREQADKAAAKDRLQSLVNRRTALGDRIGRLGEEADPWMKEGLTADHVALREKIEQEIQDWRGNTTREAVTAMKARDEAAKTGSAAGTKPAADAVDRAVQRILASDRDLSRQDLQSRAGQWVDRLIGSPDGRLAYDDARTEPGFRGGNEDARGSLMARRMPIAVNELISRGFINTSATHGVASLARTIIPDVLLTKRFGDVGMEDVMRRINDEYAGKITATTGEKASTKLIKERDAVTRDLSAARDRLRGVYGWDPSPASRKYGGMLRDMQNINALRALGTSVANRMTDATNAVFRYGFMNVFRDAFAPFLQAITNSELRNVLRQQAHDAAVGIDGLLGHMRQNLYDVNNSYAPGNKFSRGLAWATDKSMIANMHGPWTDWNKIMVFNVAQGELGRMSARVVAGTATKRDLASLAGLSIDHATAARIAGQFDAHAIEVSGRRFANQANWTDQGAKRAFEAAMSREANATVLTAGIGDKPLLMDTTLGKLGLQFKSFTAAAHEKILLSSLQKHDMRTVEGVLASVAMGMIGTALYKTVSGQQIGSDPRDWIKEGLDRSAMTGWFGDFNNAISKVTAGQADYNRLYGAGGELTRRREQSLEGILGGPTVDLAEKLAQAGSHAVTRNQEGGTKFTGADLHNARVALPLQNLWAFRMLLDHIEESMSNAFGLKPRPKPVVH